MAPKCEKLGGNSTTWDSGHLWLDDYCSSKPIVVNQSNLFLTFSHDYHRTKTRLKQCMHIFMWLIYVLIITWTQQLTYLDTELHMQAKDSYFQARGYATGTLIV